MSSMRGRGWCAALAATALFNLHPQVVVAQGSAREYRQVHLGMEVRVVIHAHDTAAADQAARAAFARIAELEDVFSDWRPQSEVRRLMLQSRKWVGVSHELFDALSCALTLARRSGGAFDPTVGLLTQLWREAKTTGTMPDRHQLAAARSRTGWKHVRLDTTARAVRLGRAGMRIDLGGIAKGYILQEASRMITSSGLPQNMVEAGGDIHLGAAPPGTEGWRIAASTGTRDTTLVIHNVAVATSGSSEQFVLINGRRYSHILDPRTGLGVTHARQVTVVAHDGMIADGLATTLVILDPLDGARAARHYDVVATLHSP